MVDDNGGSGYVITATKGGTTSVTFITDSAGGGSDVYQIVEQN